MNLLQWLRYERSGMRLMEAVRWYCNAPNDMQVETVRRLLDAGADANYVYEGRTVLAKSVRSPWCHADVVRLLLKHGANVDGTHRQGIHPPLVEGCHQSTPERLRLLVDAGANLNAVGIRGRMPLTELTPWAPVELIEYFLQHGANPNRGYFNGNTAIHFAALVGRPEIVALYIQYGADVTMPSLKGVTPLQIAMTEKNDTQESLSSKEDYETIIRLLREAGATE